MAEITDLNVTDASNTARMPENQAPSTVNNGVRALEGLLARGFKDALEGDKNSTGSSNAYAVAANRTISAYYDGMRVGFHASFTNDGAATLNVDAVGAKSLVKNHDAALASGDIEQHQYVDAIFSASDDAFQMLSPVANAPASDSSPDDIITTRGDLIHGNSSANAARLAVGSAGTVFQSDGTDPAWTDVAASQAQLETGSSTIVYTTPGRQQFHQSASKCWGDISLSGGTPTLDASYNVTSITDDSVGNVTVTIATDFSSANYAVVASIVTSGNMANITTKAAGSFSIASVTHTGAASDAGGYLFICFGDQ